MTLPQPPQLNVPVSCALRGLMLVSVSVEANTGFCGDDSRAQFTLNWGLSVNRKAEAEFRSHRQIHAKMEIKPPEDQSLCPYFGHVQCAADVSVDGDIGDPKILDQVAAWQFGHVLTSHTRSILLQLTSLGPYSRMLASILSMPQLLAVAVTVDPSGKTEKLYLDDLVSPG